MPLLSALRERLEQVKKRHPSIAITLVVVGVLWWVAGQVSTAQSVWSWSAPLRKVKMSSPTAVLFPYVPWSMFLIGLLWLGVLALWPKRHPAITGEAELLAIRLDINDLELDHQLQVEHANFGAFVKMFVTSNDRPRTIRDFRMEVRMVREGIVLPEITHSVRSERKLGNWRYRYERITNDDYGNVNHETIREPMQDLVELLRVPLQPYTHVEGWVRFEMNEVRQELKTCSITVFALDHNGQRYEIDTTRMQVFSVADHRFVVRG